MKGDRLDKPLEEWLDFVRRFSEAFDYGKQLSSKNAFNKGAETGKLDLDDEPKSLPKLSGLKIVICSPHPDDECLTGALPLRLQSEANASIINLAITLGSDPERKEERLQELMAACNIVGFKNRLVVQPLAFPLLSPIERQTSQQSWLEKVDILSEHFQEIVPTLVCVPHEHDGHPTHEAVSFLVSDALRLYSSRSQREVLVAESEFWHSLAEPNLLVGISDKDLARLIAGVFQHRGEISRNPYHLRMPARLMDNVRRGGELIRGTAGIPPGFCFGELYRLSCYVDGEKRQWPLAKMIFPPGIPISSLMQPC